MSTRAAAAGHLRRGPDGAGDPHRCHLGCSRPHRTLLGPVALPHGHLDLSTDAGPSRSYQPDPCDLHHGPRTCAVVRGGHAALLLPLSRRPGNGPGTERPDVAGHSVVSRSGGQGSIQRERPGSSRLSRWLRCLGWFHSPTRSSRTSRWRASAPLPFGSFFAPGTSTAPGSASRSASSLRWGR